MQQRRLYPEIVKITIDNEIDGFERTTIDRLLRTFDSIELIGSEKRKEYLDNKSKNFDPEIHDEGCIEEEAYFEEVNYISTEEILKSELLNSISIWLFHLFEKQKRRFFGSDKTDLLKSLLLKNGYCIDKCPDWHNLNKELRSVANAAKHGTDSDAALYLSKNHPNLISNQGVKISELDIRRYINSMREFWKNVFKSNAVL